MRRLGVLVLGLASCAHAPISRPLEQGPVPADVAERASAGVTDPALRELLARDWSWRMSEDPMLATDLGDHRFDDRIDDNSREHQLLHQRTDAALLAEARALPTEGLSAADRTTLALYIADVAGRVAVQVCDPKTWQISAGDQNPLSTWNTLPDSHKVVTVADGKNLVARYRQLARHIDNSAASLHLGAAAGRFASATSVRLTLAMVDEQLGKSVEAWPLYTPITEAHEGWPPAELASYRLALRMALEKEVRVALKGWRDPIVREIVPHARPDDQVGLKFLPGGEACYAAEIARHTTTDLSAKQLHALGLEEIARIDHEMQDLGEKLFGTRDLPAIQERLRTDPALFFRDEAEVEAAAKHALASSKARLPDFFGVLPKADCIVRRVPDFKAPYTTIAYYDEPHADGTPGTYWINTFAPTTRPRYEAEVLAYHESIPGHHLQIAIGQELTAMPEFRKNGDFTAFVEGWALYTEKLADEMGLYDGPLDRMGMLSFDAWRASRLVVDTGIHAEGWSREQAVKYMLAHTALAENNIRNEVDRYISTPGQALAYKVGQLTIRRLRKHAEEVLGPRFDLKAFHDAVLTQGAVTMAVLERGIDRWIAERK